MAQRYVMETVLCSLLIIALGLLPPLLHPLPITFQSLGVMLAGAFLGPIRGALACVLFLLFVGFGLPVLAGGHGTWGALSGPAAGYLWAWPLCAFLVGVFMRAAPHPKPAWLIFLGLVLGGVIALHLAGIVWSAHILKIPFADALRNDGIFLPGALIKAFLATLIVREKEKRAV